uniref:Uncharacterized protein n=1 Tax=Oryza barthii TaxID=65489 RepID=A0A0D3HTJ0_9ORYZ
MWLLAAVGEAGSDGQALKAVASYGGKFMAGQSGGLTDDGGDGGDGAVGRNPSPCHQHPFATSLYLLLLRYTSRCRRRALPPSPTSSGAFEVVSPGSNRASSCHHSPMLLGKEILAARLRKSPLPLLPQAGSDGQALKAVASYGGKFMAGQSGGLTDDGGDGGDGAVGRNPSPCHQHPFATSLYLLLLRYTSRCRRRALPPSPTSSGAFEVVRCSIR